MRLDWAMLATAAEGRDGLVSMLGGGWDTVTSSIYPTPFVGSVVFRVLLSPHEALQQHTAGIRVMRGAGELRPAVTFPLKVTTPRYLPEGWDLAALASVNLTGLMIPEPGMYAIEITLDGRPARRVPFQFRADVPGDT